MVYLFLNGKRPGPHLPVDIKQASDMLMGVGERRLGCAWTQSKSARNVHVGLPGAEPWEQKLLLAQPPIQHA